MKEPSGHLVSVVLGAPPIAVLVVVPQLREDYGLVLLLEGGHRVRTKDRFNTHAEAVKAANDYCFGADELAEPENLPRAKPLAPSPAPALLAEEPPQDEGPAVCPYCADPECARWTEPHSGEEGDVR